MSKFRVLGFAALIPITLGLGMQIFAYLLALLRSLVLHESQNAALAALFGNPFVIGLVQLIVSALVLLLVVESDPDSHWQDRFSFSPIRGRTLLLAFAAGAPFQVVLSELENCVRMIWPTPEHVLVAQHLLLDNTNPVHRIGLFFALVLIAPITEELLFRGAVHTRLAEHFPRAAAIALSSLAFGLAHGPIVAPMIYALVGGSVLAFVFSRTKSIFTSIALHASINATPLLLPASLVHIRGMNGASLEIEHVSAPLVIASALALMACLWGIYVFETGNDKS